MKKKRILFLFVTLFASTLLYSQVVGVKTNLVMDAMKMINLGAEVGLSKKLPSLPTCWKAKTALTVSLPSTTRQLRAYCMPANWSA